MFPPSPRLCRVLQPGAGERAGPDGKSRGDGTSAVWRALLRAAGEEHRDSLILGLSGPRRRARAGLYERLGESPSPRPPALSG